MKTIFGLILLTALVFSPQTAIAHNTLEEERKIVPLDACPAVLYEDERISVECIQKIVKSGDTLSRIATRYSTVERKLTVDRLLELNPYIKNCTIPENLRGYSAPPWNKTCADWIFVGQKVALPFAYADEVKHASELANLKAELAAEKEISKKFKGQRDITLMALAFIFAAAIFVIAVVLLHNRNHHKNNQLE